VGALDPEMVEEPDAVGRHVGDLVGRRPLVAPDQLPRGRRVALDRGGAPDVAIVVADDEEAAAGELLAQILVPAEHLHGEPHDQQQRGIGGIAERLVAELEVADGAEGLRHGRSEPSEAPVGKRWLHGQIRPMKPARGPVSWVVRRIAHSVDGVLGAQPWQRAGLSAGGLSR
jgi:hypothetical protein